MKAGPACPGCKQPVKSGPVNPYRPFCSERCRLLDLQRWLAEDYTIHEKTGADATDEPGATQDPDLQYSAPE